MQSISIVDNAGFHHLMKMGWPHYHIPSFRTVAHNVHVVFHKAKDHIVKMLQVSFSFRLVKLITNSQWTIWKDQDGRLNFAADAWTSPNSQSFLVLTVHLEYNGIPISLLLDIVKLAESHSGLNLARAFTKVLEDFNISNKVSIYWIDLDQETNIPVIS